MPMTVPENVSISPKAVSTEGCISPEGGAMKAATIMRQPKIAIATASMSWRRMVRGEGLERFIVVGLGLRQGSPVRTALSVKV